MSHQRGSDPTNATVSRSHKGRILVRTGRGYSCSELQAAGVSLAKAEGLRVHVDQRRRTKYDININRLKEIAPAKEASRSPGLPRGR